MLMCCAPQKLVWCARQRQLLVRLTSVGVTDMSFEMWGNLGAKFLLVSLSYLKQTKMTKK